MQTWTPPGSDRIKLSIVTTCLNSEATIEATLRSVAAQSHPDIEHIVIDGRSSDGTMAIVERYRGGLAAVVSEPDTGVYDAMNKGIALATGDVIGFLNSDDLYADDDALRAVAATFERGAVDACYADLVYVDREDTGKVVRYWQSCQYRQGMCAAGWVPPHPTFFARRRVFQRYGAFDLQYRLVADYEMMTRLLEVHQIQSAYIPRILVKMRLGGMTNNSFANILKGNLESYRACRQNGIARTPWPILRKLLARLGQYFARPDAARRQPDRGGPDQR